MLGRLVVGVPLAGERRAVVALSTRLSPATRSFRREIWRAFSADATTTVTPGATWTSLARSFAEGAGDAGRDRERGADADRRCEQPAQRAAADTVMSRAPNAPQIGPAITKQPPNTPAKILPVEEEELNSSWPWFPSARAMNGAPIATNTSGSMSEPMERASAAPPPATTSPAMASASSSRALAGMRHRAVVAGVPGGRARPFSPVEDPEEEHPWPRPTSPRPRTVLGPAGTAWFLPQTDLVVPMPPMITRSSRAFLPDPFDVCRSVSNAANPHQRTPRGEAYARVVEPSALGSPGLSVCPPEAGWPELCPGLSETRWSARCS